MALNRVGLSIEIAKNDKCDTLYLEDTTGEYNITEDTTGEYNITTNPLDYGLLEDTTGEYNITTNPLGYGLPGGATINNVTSIVVVLRYSTLGTYLTYTFTVLSGVIQTATLAIEGGTPVNIFSILPSTAWPFASSNRFELTGDYGVDLPELQDGVFQIEYTISGSAGSPAEAFSYTTSEQFVLDCETACCIDKMYADLDPNCGCSDEKQKKADEAYTWLQVARASAELGNTEKAVAALIKAKSICDCNCKGC
jgi:hypothetical protein